MQQTPQDSTTLTILTVRIDKAKAAYDDLCRLQSLASTDKRSVCMKDILVNIGTLKTLRLRYMTEQRYIRAYERALVDGVWQGKPIGETKRAELERWIKASKDEIAEIEAEVRG